MSVVLSVVTRTIWRDLADLQKKGGSREGDIVLTECPDVDPDTGCRYTIKKYHSEKVGTDGSWEHSKVELKPLNQDYDTIELNDVDGYRTIGVFKGVIKA